MKTKSVKKMASEPQTPKTDVELEEAMDLAGAGKYQVFHCALMLATLSAALLEMIGYAFVLPAAACDLELPEHLRGLVTSIPNIGIILTAPFWGRAADRFGRKPILLLSSSACGMIGLVAAFMPNLLGFGLCKLAGALFMSCPSSLPFAYAGEMAPRRHRDLAVLACNGLLVLSSVFNPLFAWPVLSIDWEALLGSSIKPWRVLTAVYALPLILTSVWLLFAKESPKFLMMKGRKEEALEVMKHIYAFNSGDLKEKFHVMSIKKSVEETEQTGTTEGGSALALLKPPHVQWFALMSFLMFGLYTSLNGLFLFATDTLNKVLAGATEESETLCTLLNEPENSTLTETCSDEISQDTFVIMVVSTTIVGVLVLAASVARLPKKLLLVAMFLITGSACLVAGLVTNMVVAGIAMSALQITALGIGALTAYAVRLFPTSLRGTAIGAVLMFGRVGSVAGANTAGYMLAATCMATFYSFGGLLFFCAALSFLLPKEQPSGEEQVEITNDSR